MHGFSPIGLEELKALGEERVLALAGDKSRSLMEPGRGFCNLFGTPATPFSGDGLLGEERGADHLTELLKKLTLKQRTFRQDALGGHDFWSGPLDPSSSERPTPAIFENPNLPSGYTYLLQLVAHDLVASTMSLSVMAGRSAVENARDKALLLDTLYGNGPELTPDIFEFSEDHLESDGRTPRVRLRLGPLREPVPGATHCPHRDLGRATAASITECHLNPATEATSTAPATPATLTCTFANYADDSARRTDHQKLWRTEAMVADERNDSHALLSQLTVLFHLLHNTLIDKLKPVTPNPSRRGLSSRSATWSPQEVEWRKFICARLVVTLIYRRIIRSDLMARLLHKDVYAFYAAGKRLDSGKDGIPLEFSHGAFRCGHAMVRNSYRTNTLSSQPNDTAIALELSRRYPGVVPVKAPWLLDWRFFFEIDRNIVPNYSARLGPGYPRVLRSHAIPAPELGLGLTFLDHIGSAFGGVWSVPALFLEVEKRIRNSSLANIFITYDQWMAPFSSWLGELAGRDDLPHDGKRRLSNDPPLSLFVLFEAAHTIKNGIPTRDGGGARLGVIGSIIVAETIFGALANNKVLFEGKPTLRESIAECCDVLLGVPSALADVASGIEADPRDISTMKDLIEFLSASRAFPGADR